MQPLLIIGLGGSGGKTLRAIKQALTRQLEFSGYFEGIPSAWQFLHIDVQRDGSSFPAPMLSDIETHVYTSQGDYFHSALQKINALGTPSQVREMIAGWVYPGKLIPINTMHSPNRGFGRQLAAARLTSIFEALQRSITVLKSSSSTLEISLLAKSLQINRVSSIPKVVIISSLGGGTGSGIFIDISEVLKKVTPETWASQSISLTYAPEVFESLAAFRAFQSSNILGTINEIVASRQNQMSDRSRMLYSKHGIDIQSISRDAGYGCPQNILIGCRNKTGLDLSRGWGGMDDVFLEIGTALAAVVLDADVSDMFFNRYPYLQQIRHHVEVSGLAPDPSSPNGRGTTDVFASMGFSKLSIGYEQMYEYVADALAREQVKKLLWPGLSDQVPQEGLTVEKLIEDRVNEVWPSFLQDSRMDETGSQNQILDQLFPKSWEKDCRQFAANLISKLLTDEPRSLQSFCKGAWISLENDRQEFLKDLQDRAEKQACEWIHSIQKSFRNHIAEELARSGYLVVSNLLLKLHNELKEFSLRELAHEHKQFRSVLHGFDQSSFNSRVEELAGGIKDVGKQNEAFLTKVQTAISRVLEFEIKSYVYDLASRLISDMLIHLLEPVAESLKEARHQLQIQVEVNLSDKFSSLPKWGSGVVPKRYKALMTERVLIDSSSFESVYERYASIDADGEPPFEKSVNFALLGVQMSPYGGENEQNLVQENSSWENYMFDSGENRSHSKRVDWTFGTSLNDLSNRNKRWLLDVRSQFGRLHTHSIKMFVVDLTDNEIRRAREDRFITEYVAMLNLAQPLVAFNPKALPYLNHVNNAQPVVNTIGNSSRIPFSIESRVGQACMQYLKNFGIDVSSDRFEAEWFNAASDTKTLVSISATDSSLPFWAFESLTKPILTQVAESKTDQGAWIHFCEGSRARPLTEAVPLETEIRKSIVTGWFVANLFGLIERKALPVGRSVQIWNPTLQVPNWSHFPEPLLDTHIMDARRGWWFLPQLLRSVSLALAKFGETGDSSHLDGYRLLKYLGREVTTYFDERDNWDGGGLGDVLPTGQTSRSGYIRDWLETGNRPAAERELNRTLIENVHKRSSRIDAWLETLQQFRDEYSNIWSSLINEPWYNLPETWELRDEIDLALSDIAEYAHQISTDINPNVI